MRRRRRRPVLVVFIALVLGATAESAQATQHLVAPGDEWGRLAQRVRPGDEIILMPGRHRPATFDALRGTKDQRITIRGVAPDHPAVIVAEQYGLVLHRPQYVTIEHLIITDASINGLLIDDDQTAPESATSGVQVTPESTEHQAHEPVLAHLRIHNVKVQRTGPRGDRHAILIHGLRQVHLEGVQIGGWGGSAIELVGCRDIDIKRCDFKGLADHSQSQAIVVRAGSQHVRIEHCRFKNLSGHIVVLGGVSEIDEFRPNLAPTDETGSSFEARSVQLTGCVFLGGTCPLAMVNALDCLVRNNTFVRPREAVFCIVNQQTDPRVASSQRGIFGANLTVWEPGDLRRLASVEPGAAVESFVMEQNLWWSSEPPDVRASHGSLPGESQWPQVTDVDPLLDESFLAQAEQAALFGALVR